MAKRTTGPKSSSDRKKSDEELRKLLNRPDFRSFDKMMKKLVAVPKEGLDKTKRQH